ncbi:short-subunit dehydrogenase [Leeuwenhoekiella aestuarii]|uniref:Short-subunit dehydrogenase n=1 Tax=Leeuwenhoekiella aestuarii TaxID=2249426 RepID=A0A4V1KPN2_9FLAO|nr:oxidoreductase [Leeuwenhoekiella aestuarii]RXG15991.1 short-subunit dehydrogenase [Leeuwenhoekiella aestuarii]RXG16685.1 short-subunit dehydrogenase [Leeuwenhoekiella aestuarii]
MQKVILITGASSGIGKSTAKNLLEKGHTVYGAARRIEKMQDLEKVGMHTQFLDLTDEESIKTCVNTVLEKEGRIDVLINNAGYGSYGAIEDVAIEEAKRQFEVNIFGLARITQLVLPGMRKNKQGRIVNVSSMAGKIYTPFGAWYHATKHALEGWSDCLRLELKAFDIDVVIIQPGAIKTDWGTIAAKNLKENSGSGAYADFANAAANSMHNAYTSDRLTDVGVLGKTIAKAATVGNPKRRYAKGFMAKPAMALRKWLGDGIYEKIIMSQYK